MPDSWVPLRLDQLIPVKKEGIIGEMAVKIYVQHNKK
jgi:hypothetical protein